MQRCLTENRYGLEKIFVGSVIVANLSHSSESTNQDLQDDCFHDTAEEIAIDTALTMTTECASNYFAYSLFSMAFLYILPKTPNDGVYYNNDRMHNTRNHSSSLSSLLGLVIIVMIFFTTSRFKL